jgi:hypothetical protein
MTLVARYRLTWRGQPVEPGTELQPVDDREARRLHELAMARAAIDAADWQRLVRLNFQGVKPDEEPVEAPPAPPPAAPSPALPTPGVVGRRIRT